MLEYIPSVNSSKSLAWSFHEIPGVSVGQKLVVEIVHSKSNILRLLLVSEGQQKNGKGLDQSHILPWRGIVWYIIYQVDTKNG